MMICHDCGMQIYVDDADENIGGKHVVFLWEDGDKPATARFICMPCSKKYEDVTHEVLGESYAPIGDDTEPRGPKSE